MAATGKYGNYGRTLRHRDVARNVSDPGYYHTNHLGSTAFVTDGNATVTQGFLYAPFGEITTEYNATFANGIIPKYTFNAKELDEETGMYYYEARYYAPPVFTSRDPLFEQKPWLSPYHYCSNNPANKVDPSGCVDMETDYRNTKGELLFHTDDGLNTTIIVEDANVPKLKKELQKAKTNGTINTPKGNKEHIHKLGKTLSEYAEDAFSSVDNDNYKSGYRQGYEEAYNKKNTFFKKLWFGIGGTLDENNKIGGGMQSLYNGYLNGISEGKSDVETNKINRFSPELGFKNNNPIINLH